MANEFLANQFSGELAQLTINTICDEFNQAVEIADYYKSLNIDNALPGDLYNIGLWIGLPWPTQSASTFDGTAFIFGSYLTFPIIDYNQGLGSVSDLTIGGTLGSINPSDAEYIPITFYKSLLKAFAYAKYHGITIKTIDTIARSFSDDYLIGFREFFTFSDGSEPDVDPFRGFSDDQGDGGGLLAPDVVISDSGYDINLIFLTNIGPGNLWVVQTVFDRLCTNTKVVCSIGA